MPAAIVSVVQGFDRVQRDVADVRERLIQTARATASDEESLFAAGGQVLSALSNQPEVRMGTAECGQALSNALKGLTYITNILRFDTRAISFVRRKDRPSSRETRPAGRGGSKR